ncbi:MULTISPECIES: hydroxyisourate hydrolase [Sphingobacterium]|jgi:5-hydroxyisourate hydrolase|uniref:hydroxyisourate hydrolase n=1 Tax=Sphingobacterium TaxID=28453 RepID=UPI0012300E51|nr:MULTISPECIES: hydroxyisourate hydrolase [Sphingobacterium]
MKNIIILLSFVISGFVAQAQVDKFQLSSHILDISTGQGAPDVKVLLKKWSNDKWIDVQGSKTDENGRIKELLAFSKAGNDGIYKLVFETHPYFKKKNIDSIYPFIEVVFSIKGNGHYHIPITVTPFGYSTYRGN